MVKSITKEFKKDKIRVYFIGDMHAGSRTYEKKKLELLIKRIKNEKNSYVVLMGDLAEYIFEDDTKRYNKYNVDKTMDTAGKQYLYLLRTFDSIKEKIIGVLRGNHEATYARYHSDEFNDKNRDFCELMCNELCVPYLEDLGIIELKVGKQNYTIVTAHGCGNSGSLAGHVKALNNIINSFEVVPDLVCMGHVHALQSIVNPKMTFKFKTKIKHLGLTGTFYNTYCEGNINYGSSSLFNPLPIGCLAYDFDSKGNMKDEKVILND